MKKRRRIEITVETNWSVFQRPTIASPVTVNCSQCLFPIPLISPEAAAALAGVSVRTIYRWVEAEQLHYTETSDGKLLICPVSLPLPAASP